MTPPVASHKVSVMLTLRDKYYTIRPVVTAHRGFSGKYPENTMLAFTKAYELGVDILEFDVRESADGELVIIHDPTLERTTTGTGRVDQQPLAALKRLNATCWDGTHDRGRRLPAPSGTEVIPTLEEVLEAFAGKVGLNIQVYAERPGSLETIVRLYQQYDLRDSAFLMLGTFADAERVRALAPGVAICVGEDRANIERHLAFGVDFMQPSNQCLTEAYVQRLLETGMPANVFFANDRDTMLELIARKIPGILTDVPDVLLELAAIGS